MINNYYLKKKVDFINLANWYFEFMVLHIEFSWYLIKIYIL
jgi:hypothetical protein